MLIPRDDFYASGKPRPADVILLIEVSDTSLDFDREVKRPLYAEAGIGEFWIVNLEDETPGGSSQTCALTAGTAISTFCAAGRTSKSPRCRESSSLWPISCKRDLRRPWPTGFSSRTRLLTRLRTSGPSRDRTTGWDGVRNYQARNFLRDQVQLGDGVLCSTTRIPTRPASRASPKSSRPRTPIPTAFDPDDSHYDPKSNRDSPTWYQVSIKAVRAIEPPLGLPLLKSVAALKGMELLRKGSRLSIQPVTESEWKTILALAKPKTKK